MSKRSFCVLVNPKAGSGRTLKILPHVEETLYQLPIDFRVVITERVSHAKKTAIQAIKQGEFIAVMGGDGTARAVSDVVHQHNGVLALIPGGRGNDMVRMLKLPIDPISACKVLAFGMETAIDLGKVNQQPFLGICSLGFDSIANQLANRTRLLKGRAVYLYGGLKTLFNWKSIKFMVNIDGNEFEHNGYTVAVANSKNYGGGMYIAPNASIQDGLLDIVFIGDISKLRMIINVPRVFRGTHTKEHGFEVIRGRSVKIETDPKYTIFADGDAISGPPANIEIMPSALRVLVANPNMHF